MQLGYALAEVKFVHPVSPGGSVKFVASGVNFSIFTNFLCFFLLKLLKLGEIGGVKFLTWKSGGVKFWTNSMSGNMRMKTIHTFWEGCNFNQDGLFNLIKTVTCTKKSNVPGNTQRVNDRKGPPWKLESWEWSFEILKEVFLPSLIIYT